MGASIEIDSNLLSVYVFYTTVLLAKVLVMAPWTARYRIGNKVFSNPEDASTLKGGKVGQDPDVERVRRAHLNDLENVVPFAILGFLYVCVGPAYTTALWHFRVFAAARIIHTIVYLNQVAQPSRGMAFGVGLMTCASMIVQILMRCC